MSDRITIAWDFDGVLNRNTVNGKFIWQKDFERDLGLPLKAFLQFMFTGNFQKAMVGEEDLLSLCKVWLADQETDVSAEFLLEYWFSKDAHPDQKTLAVLRACRARGFGNIIATNNEIYRTQYIETIMGFGAEVEHIFSAGRIKLAKPDQQYFIHIADSLGIDGSQLFLIDDVEENVENARAAGWAGFHFRENDHDRLARALSGL